MPEATEIPPLDPVAFFAALILAPILFTLLTFWVFFIPVFALIFGAVPYLVIGTPVILVMLGKHPCTKSAAAGVGFLCAIILAAATVIAARFAIVPQDMVALALFGTVFAPLWAVTFSILYNNFYHHPAA